MVQKKYGDTNFITGMRAFAALAILFMHAGGAGLRDFGTIGNNIVSFGATGVYVFFVISGFSVAASYESSKGFSDYINKRIWRIAPLYYFWLLVAILTHSTAIYWQQTLGAKIDLYNILMHISFLSWLDYRITNSILGVEWSIPIEVFWYFMMPSMFIVCKNHVRIVAILIFSLSIYILAIKFPTFLPVDVAQAGLAMHWNPLPYILAYALGLTAYRLRKHCIHSNTIANSVMIFSIILMSFHILYPSLTSKFFYDEYIMITFITAMLITFGTNKSFLFEAVFSNPVAQYLGIISYGIYLSHFPLLSAISNIDLYLFSNPTSRFFLVAILSTFVSSLTYYLFEEKFILFSKKASKKLIKSRIGHATIEQSS